MFVGLFNNMYFSSVLVITILRIAALDKVDTSDFTYNQAYLGLLSTLGALISVVLGSAFTLSKLLNSWRNSGTRKMIFKGSLVAYSGQRNPPREGNEDKHVKVTEDV